MIRITVTQEPTGYKANMGTESWSGQTIQDALSNFISYYVNTYGRYPIYYWT